jgi:hypothetical protein
MGPWKIFHSLVLPAALAALTASGCDGNNTAMGDDAGGGGGHDGNISKDGNSEVGDASACSARGDAGATSPCLAPQQAPEYYVEQSNKYFDTLDADAGPESVPVYSELVARWEWPPWLKLTAYGRETIISTDERLKKNSPSMIPVRECRAFSVQPFGRCHVMFKYEGGPCPIYEEFTFNDQGEMTFIEAWSDLPGLLPTPHAADRWAEGPDAHRLSTKIPGLGNTTGRIDLDSDWMKEAENRDKEVADFAKRARDQWTWWAQELQAAGSDMWKRGCGW